MLHGSIFHATFIRRLRYLEQHHRVFSFVEHNEKKGWCLPHNKQESCVRFDLENDLLFPSCMLGALASTPLLIALLMNAR